jgi:hypothetical protein
MMERRFVMRTIETIYIDGAFVTPHGHDRASLFNPATEQQIGEVRLGDAEDVNLAVARSQACLSGDGTHHAGRPRRHAAPAPQGRHRPHR